MSEPAAALAISQAVAPANQESAPTTALLLHGYGSNERDLVGISGALPDGLPWFSLRAPLSTPQGGAAWFPIAEPGSPDPATVADATTAIWNWIDTNLAPETAVVPIGFSQGGLMASELLRTRPDRIAATVVLSGFVQAGQQAEDARIATARPPAFWGRGDLDRIIAGTAVDRTTAWLPVHTTLEQHVYPGLGHGISAQEVADLREFLARLLTIPAAPPPAPATSPAMPR